MDDDGVTLALRFSRELTTSRQEVLTVHNILKKLILQILVIIRVLSEVHLPQCVSISLACGIKILLAEKLNFFFIKGSAFF